MSDWAAEPQRSGQQRSELLRLRRKVILLLGDNKGILAICWDRDRAMVQSLVSRLGVPTTILTPDEVLPNSDTMAQYAGVLINTLFVEPSEPVAIDTSHAVAVIRACLKVGVPAAWITDQNPRSIPVNGLAQWGGNYGIEVISSFEGPLDAEGLWNRGLMAIAGLVIAKSEGEVLVDGVYGIRIQATGGPLGPCIDHLAYIVGEGKGTDAANLYFSRTAKYVESQSMAV